MVVWVRVEDSYLLLGTVEGLGVVRVPGCKWGLPFSKFMRNFNRGPMLCRVVSFERGLSGVPRYLRGG